MKDGKFRVIQKPHASHQAYVMTDKPQYDRRRDIHEMTRDYNSRGWDFVNTIRRKEAARREVQKRTGYTLWGAGKPRLMHKGHGQSKWIGKQPRCKVTGKGGHARPIRRRYKEDPELEMQIPKVEFPHKKLKASEHNLTPQANGTFRLVPPYPPRADPLGRSFYDPYKYSQVKSRKCSEDFPLKWKGVTYKLKYIPKLKPYGRYGPFKTEMTRYVNGEEAPY